MANFDALQLAMSLREQLLGMVKLSKMLIAKAADPAVPSKERDALALREKELNFEIARLYPAYEAAKKGTVILKAPDKVLAGKISALCDKVQTFVKGQQATDDALAIAGEVLTMAQRLTA